MTAYVTAPLRSMFDRARRAALLRLLALLACGVAVCLALHVLQPSTVAEGLMNAGIMAVLSLKGLRL